MMRFFVFFLLAFFLSISQAYALYTDEIAVSADEVWPAAQEAFKFARLKKVNEAKRTFETKWIQDKVTQSIGPLKSFTKDEFDRRYRYKVSIQDRYGDTLVEIRAVFQKRRRGLVQYSWRLSKATADDLDVEREAFMRILGEIEKKRAAQSGLGR